MLYITGFFISKKGDTFAKTFNGDTKEDGIIHISKKAKDLIDWNKVEELKKKK